MNFKHFLLVGWVSIFSFSLNAQKKEILFTIDNHPYYTDEFIRVYNKNLDLVKDESQKDIDNYLDLYLAYKLKVKKAYDLGLDQNPKYQNELRTYRNQLSKNYLTDTEATEELIREAYDRSLKEIKASHILILLGEDATPQDTLKAYQKIQFIREKALKGEDFGQLAQEFSEDPSAKDNKGDLGYFSVFRMVYPFESGAYNTRIGKISEPVRSRFGYHLIKVNDIRDNRGEITIAHIMIAKPQDSSRREEMLNKVNTIYQKLRQGESFESLAIQFSEDTSTAQKGGLLGKIASGNLNSVAFEDAAFSIKNEREYTQPIETEFGWHIIKLLEKHPTKPFEEVKSDFENRVKRDERSKKITESMHSKLISKYKPIVNYDLLTKASDVITESYYEQRFTIPNDIDEFNQVVMTIKSKDISGIEFLNFIQSQQNSIQRIQPLSVLKHQVIKDFVDANLNKYYEENLENEFEDFRYIMNEYKEGLLLFDLMEKEIWQRAQIDTLGLEAFYQKNKDKYLWNERIDAIVASSVKRDFVAQAKKYFEEGKSIDFINKALNQDAVVNIMIDQGYYEEKGNGLPKQYTLSKGVSDIYKEGDYYYVIVGNKIISSSPKTIEEAKGRLISDYQQHLEENWLDALKNEFSYKVNNKVLKRVKKQLRK